MARLGFESPDLDLASAASREAVYSLTRAETVCDVRGLIESWQGCLGQCLDDGTSGPEVKWEGKGKAS